MAEWKDRNLYLRGVIWWARVQIDGRDYRFSTKARNRDQAGKVVLQWITARTAQHAPEAWKVIIDAWELDSQSWLHRTVRHIRAKSKKRGWTNYITLLDLRLLALESNGRCSVTGAGLVVADEPSHPFSISIDRIDCSRGYEFDNCRIACLMANLAMRNWGEDALKKLSLSFVAKMAEDAYKRGPMSFDAEPAEIASA